ncbi:MAG TPA: hypothetical protein DD727_03395 [Clostridiales bacterium]|nr:hypothetical protein [Clostridiales bacterium]
MDSYAIIPAGTVRSERTMDICKFKNQPFDIFYVHASHTGNFKYDFHYHYNNYEILFFLSGDVEFNIDKKTYILKPGDLILLNYFELHKPFIKSSAPYERIMINFNPHLLKIFNITPYNLLNCFDNRLVTDHSVMNLNREQYDDLYKIMMEFEDVHKKTNGSNMILEFITLVRLLVFINDLFEMNTDPKSMDKMPVCLQNILTFIDDHIHEDLTLEHLSRELFISQQYLSRIFKSIAGMNLHKYITMKRLTLAKKLLTQGESVTDACMMSGFNNYANFIKVFKKYSGMTPGQFKNNT